jgi:hypothetical protein
MATSAGSYYATSTGTSTNYAVITNLYSNTLVGGIQTSDRLQLNLQDYNSSKYSLGATASARTTTHFGLYDNGAYVADITTTGTMTVATDGSQDNEFFKVSNNHVTYV